MCALFSILLFISASILITAYPSPCYTIEECEIDPEKMRAAIELIPSPPVLPLNRLDAGAYRLPAIFEASWDAQILIRADSAFGLTLDTETLMTYLWPYAKQEARELYDECSMERTSQSARTRPLLQWRGQPLRSLGFEMEMTCDIDKALVPGVTTYTASGIENAPG